METIKIENVVYNVKEGLSNAISELVPDIVARSERFLPVGLLKSKDSSDPRGKEMLFMIKIMQNSRRTILMKQNFQDLL